MPVTCTATDVRHEPAMHRTANASVPVPFCRNSRRGLVTRAAQKMRVFFYRCISDCRSVEGKPTLHQPLLLKGAGSVIFGADVSIGYFPSPHFMNGCVYLEARNPGALISIGDGAILNNNVAVIAEHKTISIGRHVLIGTNVEIIDSDFHGLKPDDRGSSPSDRAGDVVVGDNCLLGSNVQILKGVTIGENSVVGNGAVVVDDIPPNAVAVGNPARVVRYLQA